MKKGPFIACPVFQIFILRPWIAYIINNNDNNKVERNWYSETVTKFF